MIHICLAINMPPWKIETWITGYITNTWWRHQMETFSALLALCAGNSLITGEFPTQRPVTRSLDVFFDLCLNKRLSKQWWGWWFETPSCPLWRHCNEYIRFLARWYQRFKSCNMGISMAYKAWGCHFFKINISLTCQKPLKILSCKLCQNN